MNIIVACCAFAAFLAVTGAQNNNLPAWSNQYLMYTGNRCASETTRVIGTGRSRDDCANLCLNDDTCIGFDFNRVDNTCRYRASLIRGAIVHCTIGCDDNVNNGNDVWYFRLNDAVRQTSAQQFQPTDDWRSNFDAHQGSRCSGGRGYVLGQAFTEQQCARLCLRNSVCTGFNFDSSSQTCDAWAYGCEESQDGARNYIFYKRQGVQFSPSVFDRYPQPLGPAPPVYRSPPQQPSYQPPARPQWRRPDAPTSDQQYLPRQQAARNPFPYVPADRADAPGFQYAPDTANRAPSVVYQPAPATDEPMPPPPPTRRYRPAPTTTQEMPPPPPPPPQPAPAGVPASIASWRASFDTPMQSHRCSAGSSTVLGSGTTKPECASQCIQNSDCYGFNFNNVDNTCEVRSSGCVDDDSTAENWTFFKKLSQ